MITQLQQFRSHIIVGASCLVIGILIGLAIGWKLYHHEKILETAAPEQVLDDLNITVLQRLPENVAPPVPKKLEKAAKRIGGKLERAGEVVVKPEPTPESPAECECEEVKIDFGLVDTGNGKRVVATAEGGKIIGGYDIPLEPYVENKESKWEVGAVVPVEYYEGVGPYVSRKVGPFSVGVQAMQPSQEEGWTAMATVGVRFYEATRFHSSRTATRVCISLTTLFVLFTTSFIELPPFGRISRLTSRMLLTSSRIW